MSVVLVIMALVGGFTLISVIDKVGSAWAARLKSTAGSAAELQRQLAELEQRLAEMESRLHEIAADDERLLDLEERVEFTERLLQQLRDPERLPPGGA